MAHWSGLLFTTLHPVLLGINPFELIGPGLVLFVINDFLLTLVLIQHCVAIMRIDELISNHGISPRAFHSDGANGLGAIGGYAVVTGSLAILYGVWLSVMFGIGLNRGEAPHWGASPIILLMTYVFAVGLLAVGPLLSPHARMKAYRDLRLDAVAARIQLMLDAEADGACTVMPSDQMSGLRERYHFIRNAYGEWPVHMTAFRGFSLAALIPLVSSIVSIVAKVMKAG